MNKITPCIWTDHRIEEQVGLYMKLFGNSRILSSSRYSEGMHRPAGEALTIEFELDGQRFQALNGGGDFHYTHAVSFSISCSSQAEVDHFYDGLIADGGKEQPCAWLIDRYGLSWQVVPDALPRLLSSPDRAAAGRVMQAMLKMKKIIVADLEAAAKG